MANELVLARRSCQIPVWLLPAATLTLFTFSFLCKWTTEYMFASFSYTTNRWFQHSSIRLTLTCIRTCNIIHKVQLRTSMQAAFDEAS
jgi:hypothetical protein